MTTFDEMVGRMKSFAHLRELIESGRIYIPLAGGIPMYDNDRSSLSEASRLQGLGNPMDGEPVATIREAVASIRSMRTEREEKAKRRRKGRRGARTPRISAAEKREAFRADVAERLVEKAYTKITDLSQRVQNAERIALGIRKEVLMALTAVGDGEDGQDLRRLVQRLDADRRTLAGPVAVLLMCRELGQGFSGIGAPQLAKLLDEIERSPLDVVLLDAPARARRRSLEMQKAGAEPENGRPARSSVLSARP
jgi:hypothetical protein